ncbi:BatD family protein [Mesohalobacter halotolerans]|uniref:Protein BatD n=1 Tax=Mesohalobacter halotolerans TaxID=1883405 RepID=A0A4U5TU39_9FLAO|nr:BatD family protein [Mesohalobacter halotolerans]MBS3739094.1 protein BatD [Psychroflexus sp.]TKS57014.1 protein BatD [Mesohalobacter halotolerans]
MKKLIYILILISCAFSQAQVQFTAEVSREKLGINERLRVEFSMNKDGDNFIPPSFEGFRKIAGPNQSVSQSWINGKSTFQKSYTFFLQPLKRGKLTINQAEVTIDGKVYKTSPKTVEVTAAVDNPSETADATPQSKALDGIHLVAEVSDTSPYLNEGIYVVYKLYVSPSTDIRNWRALDNPKYENFWSQSIDVKRLEVKNGEFAGKPYRYVELRKTILYPQKTGKLKIEPLTLSIGVEVPTKRRDLFGRRLYETVEKTYSAQTRTIDVQALPQANKPASFTGAVGKFDFEVNVDKNKLKAMESLQAEVKLSGEGNMSLFELPPLKAPNNTEIFEPEKQDNIRTTVNGMVGSKRNIYTLVPQQAGKQVIPSLEFSYFDPTQKRYITLNSNSISIEVEPNTSLTNSTSNSDTTGSNYSFIKPPDAQFTFIKLDTTLRPINQKRFFKSTAFWTISLITLALFPFFIVFKKVQNREGLSESDRNRKKANKLAKKFLSEAKSHLNDSNAFYLSLEKALHNYLKAKLRITTSEMSKEKIEELLLKKGAKSEDVQSFLELLKNCEMARYSPLTQSEIDQDYQHAKATLAKLDRNL